MGSNVIGEKGRREVTWCCVGGGTQQETNLLSQASEFYVIVYLPSFIKIYYNHMNS